MKPKGERPHQSKWFNVATLGWAVLAGVFLIAWYYMDNYFLYTVDSDMSSELMLGRILAEENAVITKNWYYSTVLEIIDINLVWALMFKLTDNWHTVRVLGSMIFYALMLLSLYYCCRKAGMREQFGYVGAVLLLPVSVDYFDVVIRGVYYAATIVTALLSLGLWFAFLKAAERKRRAWLLAAGLLISAVGGLCGPMQLVMFNIPMALAALLLRFLDREDSCPGLLLFPLLMALATVAGYVFSNGVLAKLYDFQVYEEMLFTSLSMDKIMRVINGFLNIFGYRAGQSIFSKALLINAAAGVWTLLGFYSAFHVLAKRRAYEAPARLLACMYLAYFTVMLLAFAMSSKAFATRYLAMTVIFAALAVFACFGKGWENPKTGRAVLAAFMAMCLLCGALTYNDLRKMDDTKGQREAAQALVEQGYTQGYATFWNANVLTELSNGQLEVWHWNDGKQHIETLEDFNDIYPWLQAKSHLTNPPEGKVFVLLSANEDYYYEFTKKFSQEHVIYRAENYYDYGYKDYIAYGFSSYEELEALLSK